MGYEGFDNPVGTPEERMGIQVWPPGWIDANPYLNKYDLGFHTGSDLNMYEDKDAHAGVYATEAGQVIYARVGPSTWGNLIVIRHDTPEGVVYSRYGHVENIQVVEQQIVQRGQQICNVGNAFGRWAYHLHFDISTHPTRLRDEPYDWSAWTVADVKRYYVDPRLYIAQHRPTHRIAPNPRIVAPNGVIIYDQPGGVRKFHLPKGEQVIVHNMQTVDGVIWVEAAFLDADVWGWTILKAGDDIYLL